jgi:hypothetical protein
MFIRKRSKHAYLILLFGFLFVSSYLKSQNWPKIYGNNIHAYVNRIYEDYDKGYLIGGSVLSNPNTFRYVWIIKTDINGNEIWNKKFGNNVDQFYLNSCLKTANEGLIICGGTAVEDPLLDPFFVKLNVCSEPEWCSILLSEDYNVATDIIALKDGYIGMLKYYGEGEQYARISLIKMDSAGEPIWIQQLAQEDTLIYNEEGNYLYLTSDSNYLVSGTAYHPGKRPFWIMTDTSGIQVWDLFWNSLVGQAHQVVEKDSGIFYSTSWGIGASGPQSPVLLKFDRLGNPIDMYFLMGDTIVGGSSSPINFLNDTNLIIGFSWRNVSFPVDDGYSEIFITDTLGNVLTRRLLLNENTLPKRIIKTSDNKILVTGNYVVDNNWDIYLWKMNANLEDDTLYTQPLTYDSLCPYEIQSDTVDLDCSLFVNIDEIPTKEAYESTIKISPNPARDWITLIFPENISSGHVELAIYNIFGQEVVKKEVFPDNRTTSLNISNLSSGIYIAVSKDQRKRIMKGKFVVTR